MSALTVEFSNEGLVRDAKKAFLAVLLFAGIVSVAHCGSGCLPANSPTVEEQSYTTAIIACAATAGYPGSYDRQADLRCRAEVDCDFGVAPCAGK